MTHQDRLRAIADAIDTSAPPPSLRRVNGWGHVLVGRLDGGLRPARFSMCLFTVMWIPVFSPGTYLVAPTEVDSGYGFRFYGRISLKALSALYPDKMRAFYWSVIRQLIFQFGAVVALIGLCTWAFR